MSIHHTNMELHTENMHSLAITRLYNAALMGQMRTFEDVLKEDPLILDRCIFEKSCLYMQSPLHIAASKGHVDMVKTMIMKKPNMCSIHDQDGMNPSHVASIEGHIDVLRVLYQRNSYASRERNNNGETIFHLCVKYNHLKALEMLVELTNDIELLNSKDNNGNTVLHLAVTGKQIETINYLLKNKRIDKNATNNNGLTAMDTFIQTRNTVNECKEIKKALKRAKVLQAKDTPNHKNEQRTWLEKQSSALMVVASLIATMAFQVGINPPGGAWQDSVNGQHTAGSSIMAKIDETRYNQLVISNTIGLVSSLSVILLLISGLPCKRLFVGILMITMWVAITSTTFTYLVSMSFVSSTETKGTDCWYTSLTLWVCLMIALIIAHTFRIIVKIIKKVVQLVISLYHKCFTRATNYPPV